MHAAVMHDPNQVDDAPRAALWSLPTFPAALPPGTILAGRYAIQRRIHRGGMSVVYMAEDRAHGGRRVALKELRFSPTATAADRREAEGWFARESFLLSSLHHPLIPAFFNIFREDGHAYLVEEYVEGENLDDLVRRHGPQDEARVVAWGLALSGLLRYLHARPDGPLIYRDLKPANIVLRAYDGRLTVVDFGIARSIRPGEVGTIIGTPGYAAPEQYQGLATPESDTYALGATLHRLLTGYDPERGAPFTFPPIQELRPLVSPEMAALVGRAVQLDPAERFPTARAMSAALSEQARRLRAASRPRLPSGVVPRRTPAGLGPNWLGAWALPAGGAALLAVDPLGRLAAGSVLIACLARVGRLCFGPQARKTGGVAAQAALTFGLVASLAWTAAQGWFGWWALSLGAAALALGVAFLVGDDEDPWDWLTWGRSAGYGLAALLGAVPILALALPGAVLSFPLGTAFILLLGAPGAALGGLGGGVLRALTD
jgi:hypothetical protein